MNENYQRDLDKLLEAKVYLSNLGQENVSNVDYIIMGWKHENIDGQITRLEVEERMAQLYLALYKQKWKGDLLILQSIVGAITQ